MYNVITEKQGWIEVICGSMYSGKSEELIRRLKRAFIAKQRVAIFKPQIDHRYSEEHIVSHDQNKLQSIRITQAEEILQHIQHIDVVGIDEAQFLDQALVKICNQMAFAGIRVIVAGLDMDFRGEPFAPMPQLMAIAEEVTKTHAICVVCGNLAQYTQRIIHDDKQIVIGSHGSYEARCRLHYIKPKELEKKNG